MKVEDRIIAKLNEHDGKLSKMLETQDRMLATQDKLIEKVIEIDEKIDTLATKDAVADFEGRMVSMLDTHTKMLENLDHERLAMISRIEIVEGDISDVKRTLSQ